MKKISLTSKKLKQKISWLISIVLALLNNMLKVCKNLSLQVLLILGSNFRFRRQFFFILMF